ncbi:hypothetical protein GGS21DRAFT_493842 [Xylaria nigripes]|nr:hypothetical protein GGS21DRAFT_493842 [Xylaria nigripes]
MARTPLTKASVLRSASTTRIPRRLTHQLASSPAKAPDVTAPQQTENKEEQKKKTVAQQDEELRQKMSGLAGDGGEAGVEYEDGKPVAMKRGVRTNMFRYI